MITDKDQYRELRKAGNDVKLINSLEHTGFSLVYQSGHGNVYCDKRIHIWTYGGHAGMAPIKFDRLGYCDCYKWRSNQ